MDKSTNTYADIMLEKISQCIEQETKDMPALSGAVVSSVNTDGTVNVYFPPDNNKIFTNISNQTPFYLEPGDSVELLLKDGSYNNCWVVAKHQTTFNGITDIDGLIEQIQQYQSTAVGMRKIKTLDFSDFDNGTSSGSFTEITDDDEEFIYRVDFDNQGRPITIHDSDTHQVTIIWA